MPSKQNLSSGPHRLRGMRMRAEFLCPITYELLTDPVIAADGNTYERAAIEKWISKTQTSPLSGETLPHTMLSPNRALKKIIQDLIAEGGVGLYTMDTVIGQAVSGDNCIARPIDGRERGVDENGFNVPSSSSSSSIGAVKSKALVKPKLRCIDVYREHVLCLKCVGPPEVSDLFQKTFLVGPRGMLGGRNNYGRNIRSKNGGANMQDNNVDAGASSTDQENHSGGGEYTPEDMLVFKDSNISRQHFEIALVRAGVYAIRDLGSVGGTYLRVPYSSLAAELSIPLVPDSTSARESKALGSASLPEAKSDDGLVWVDSLRSDSDRGLLCGQRLRPFAMILLGKHQFIVEKIDDRYVAASNSPAVTAADAAALVAEVEALCVEIKLQQQTESPDLLILSRLRQELKQCQDRLDGKAWHADRKEDFQAENGYALPQHLLRRRCVLTCVGPDGSPCVGKSFTIGAGGAVIGRNPAPPAALVPRSSCNAVSDRAQAKEGNARDSVQCSSGQVLVPIAITVTDNAMSSEHARILMDGAGEFYLVDGSLTVQATVDTGSGSKNQCGADSDARFCLKLIPQKNSTNGSWLRLAAAAKVSPWYVLRAGMEVQVSQVRFTVSQGDDTVYEKDVDVPDDGQAE